MSESLERVRAVLGGLDVNLQELLRGAPAGAADPLHRAGAVEWVALDGVLRGWNRAAPAAPVAFALLDGRPAPVVSALLACHRDGYVREAALRRPARVRATRRVRRAGAGIGAAGGPPRWRVAGQPARRPDSGGFARAAG